MPLYEYKCLKCGRHTEKIESVNGPHLRKCPHCSGKVESVISAPAIQFKGSGWYVTDYAGKSPDATSKDASAAADSKNAAGNDSGGKNSGSNADTKTASEKSADSNDRSPKESGPKDRKPAKKR